MKSIVRSASAATLSKQESNVIGGRRCFHMNSGMESMIKGQIPREETVLSLIHILTEPPSKIIPEINSLILYQDE